MYVQMALYWESLHNIEDHNSDSMANNTFHHPVQIFLPHILPLTM